MSKAEYQRRWRDAHPGRQHEYYVRWYAKHGTETLARRKAARVHHPRVLLSDAEKRRRQAARDRQRNERFPEKVRERNRRYRAAHPEQIREYVRRADTLRRMREDATPGHHTVTEWRALIARCGGRCVYCGTADRPLTRDHIVPVSLGGGDDIGNIVPACKPCNSRKWKHTAEPVHARGGGDSVGQVG